MFHNLSFRSLQKVFDVRSFTSSLWSPAESV